MERFTLTIELGNDAMQTGADIADALRRVAARQEEWERGTDGAIRDENGNTVGRYGFE